MGDGSAETDKRKIKNRIRFERAYSNSLWHVDYKLLDDGRWFVACMDDASRFITGYGLFENATGRNAIEVLHEAIKNHGKPASILTDREPEFYTIETETRNSDASEFEKELVRLGIRHMLVSLNHRQTSGKISRFYGEITRKLCKFHSIDGFVDWYNNIRPHTSLDFKTPARTFVEKMPPEGTASDGQTGKSVGEDKENKSAQYDV